MWLSAYSELSLRSLGKCSHIVTIILWFSKTSSSCSNVSTDLNVSINYLKRATQACWSLFSLITFSTLLQLWTNARSRIFDSSIKRLLGAQLLLKERVINRVARTFKVNILKIGRCSSNAITSGTITLNILLIIY